MKPSVFTQLEHCTPVGTRLLKPSPRVWNPGLMRYKDRLWMCYRYHLREADGRCATAITEMDPKTLQPMGPSQRLAFEGPTGTEHHEDARLFLFGGQPYISYTEMRGYRPGVDYVCVMRYAQLRMRGAKWEIVDEWQPEYGSNNGRAKEKNWVFFEHDHAIHCVYADSPKHIVLRLEGEKVVQIYESPGASWHFGPMRGGTNPVRMADGNFLAIFHSSVPSELPPAYVRYYGAAMTFAGKPPFEPLQISTKPIMVGSEVDGHQVDPRYVAGWKPFVTFPAGLVEDGDGWLCSIGVNDWQCAVARLRLPQLLLGAADGTDVPPRYFKRANGSIPVLVMGEHGRRQPVEWIVPRTRNGMTSPGFMMLTNQRQAQEVSEFVGVEEVGASAYEAAILALSALRG
jgi:predicted GH43/DUF377 family glycosyl hydrolase